MKYCFLFGILLSCYLQGISQTISVAGQCIATTATLNKVADVNGKVAYQGTGTVDGNANVAISIYWLTPENAWVLDFDGQPYFYSNCDRSTPPSTTNVSCSWIAVEGQACTGGTALSISGTGTLPVRLSSFTATKAGSQVYLRWITAMESNNKGFDIQRSRDGNQWSSIGFVNGAGSSSQDVHYTFTDALPLAGQNYYRLVQVDYDNRQTISPVVSVDVTMKGIYVLQQAGSGMYKILIVAEQPVELTLLDGNGKKLFRRSVARGLHPIDLTPYAQGVYLLQLQNKNLVHTEKLIK